ncbi:MAG: phosphatidate cytidylyltransferase [Prolixibacteraceae bacterium]|nr:phosphatidate cytidylyltransferase [Prolixibacteraceae bacterium]MBN2775777.1 phosphatidate cytidylyltransferase [Prolixibacteraceae bacterium]
MKDLVSRTYTAIIFVIIIVAGIIIRPYIFAIIFAFVLVLVMKEFYEMAKNSGASPQKIPGIVLGLMLFFLMFLKSSGIFPENSIWLIIPFAFSVFIIELYRNKEKPLSNIALTLGGVIFTALPFSLLNFFIFTEVQGHQVFYPWLMLGIFFILWSYDTSAYLFGIKFGKFKLFERISPKKSWEGVIGGAVIALIVGILNSVVFYSVSLMGWIGIALIIIVFGTLGDLIESMFKRSLNIKDSGKILPGHGGVLDRLDSLIFATPFIFTWLMIIS